MAGGGIQMLKQIAGILSKATIVLAVFTLAIYITKIIFYPVEVHLYYGFSLEENINKIAKWDLLLDLSGFKKIKFEGTYNFEEVAKYKNILYPNNLTEQFIFIIGRNSVFINPLSENAESEFKKAVCENNPILPRCFI